MLIRARVIRGKGAGRRLGFPTANLNIPRGVKVPSGVYKVEVSLKGRFSDRPGVCNIGTGPTLGGGKRFIEVHIPGFRGNLYGKTLTVRLNALLRKEKRFSSLSALIAQIRRDVKKAMKIGPKTQA